MDFLSQHSCVCCKWPFYATAWRVVEAAAEFFKKRAGKATGAGLRKFLRRAPDVTPEPEDAGR